MIEVIVGRDPRSVVGNMEGRSAEGKIQAALVLLECGGRAKLRSGGDNT